MDLTVTKWTEVRRTGVILMSQRADEVSVINTA